MHLRLADQKLPVAQQPFPFLRRLRLGQTDGLAAPVEAPAEAANPAELPPDDPSEAAQAVLREAAAWQARHNHVASPASGRIVGGLVVKGGELVVWAVDRRQPLRPVAIALLADGVLVFDGLTDPAGGAVARNTGCQLAAYRAIDLLVNGRATRATGYGDSRVFVGEPVRAELAEHLARERRTYRARVLRRSLQNDIDDTLLRLARTCEPEPDGPPAFGTTSFGTPAYRQPVAAGLTPEWVVSPLLRYQAQRWKTRVHASTPMALASWIIGEVLEDPAQRQVFCLDPDTEALLNAPAFTTGLVPGDISLALLCFWRRHYPSTDLFSDEGLRFVQYKFATAPFIGMKNNHLLVSEGLRERLAAPVPGIVADGLPVSWYWLHRHRDQGDTERLRDPQHVLALSFREVVSDALDPERLSFTPRYWKTWWAAWAMGEGSGEGGGGIGLSRFDLALVALIAGTDRPELLVAEHGPRHWRERLTDAVYRGMPGLTVLSSCAVDLPLPVEQVVPRRDLAIIGHVNRTGLARNMAMFCEALAGCRPLLFDASTGRCLNAEQPQDADVRAAVVLLCVNANTVPEMIGRFASLCEDAHLIGFFLWETDQPPETHRYGAHLVDEIWTPTSFVAEAYRKITSLPVAVVGKGLRAPEPRAWQPFVAGFRDRSPAFTFLVVCDFSSSIVRKNPLDAIRAFHLAFDRGNDNVRLVLKVRQVDPAHWSNIDGYWEDVERLVAGDPRIDILTGDLPDEDYWALIAASDALLSLHRGEGFAYPVTDAMLIGRPVVVSDYSGTRDYCTAETALLVEVEVVATPPAHLRCTGSIGNWALPRLDSAVAAMRRVVTQRAETAERVARARAHIAAHYDFDAWRDGLLERLAPHLRLACGLGRPAAAPALITFASPGIAAPARAARPVPAAVN